jgi:hypothetical protein
MSQGQSRMETSQSVAFFDAWKQRIRTGTLIAVRQSARNPWKVAVVRLQDGTEVEVHPDRLESAGENHHDR